MDTSDSYWYQKGLSFECTQCGQCCSGPGTGFVWVTESEVAAIAKAVGMDEDLEGFERKFTRKIGARVSLVEYSDGDCIFLEPETRRCSVYESRPVQCRTWPFWESNVATPKDWAEISRNCPGCNRGRLYQIEEIRSVIHGGKPPASF